MFGIAVRKKINENQLANIFVNSIIEVVENGFGEVAELINEDVAFTKKPEISGKKFSQFLLIVTVGNLHFLRESFEDDEAEIFEEAIILRFAEVLDISKSEFYKLINETKKFIHQVNFPSKNILYGMSKAIFFKYNLNPYQESYFKSMNSPNPLFLKRLDDILLNFMWDWDNFQRKYKIN